MDVLDRTLARVGIVPWVRSSAGTWQLFCPEWLYDVLVYVLFPVNFLINLLASRFPAAYTASDWPLDREVAPGKLAPPRAPLKELAAVIRGRDDTAVDDVEVWKLFDSLPAPKTNDMIGNWRGKVVYTGSWLDFAGYGLELPLGRLLGLQWGKRFLTPYKGDPLIFIAGNALFPVPLWGSVSLPEIALRGKVGATMTYDHQPWKDHFRVLDDGKQSGRRMMLGNWMAREKNGGWFTLEELPEFDKAVGDLLVHSPY